MNIAKLITKIIAKKNTLRTQLLLVLISVTLIPIIAIGTFTYITTIGKITEISLNTLKNNSYNNMNNVDVKINSVDSIIKGVSSQPNFLVGLEMVNSTNNELDTVVYSSIQLSMKNAVESSNKLIQTMYLCDKNGKIIAAGSKNYKAFINKYFYDIKLFENIKTFPKEDFTVGKSFYSEELKIEVIPITRVVSSLAGFSGTITALVNYNNFFSLFENGKNNNEVMVLDNNLNIIYHQDKEKISHKITDKSFINQFKQNKNNQHITYNDFNTKKVLYMNVSKLSNWIICSQTNYSVVMSPVREYIFVILIVIILSLTFTLVVSIVYSNYIAKPVTELTALMKKIEDGYLEIELKSSKCNIYEINSLRNTFYKMVLNLNSLITNISSASKEIDSMTSVMYDAACSSIEQSEYTQKSVQIIDENIRKQAEDANYAAEGIHSLAKQIATSRELSQNVYSYLGMLNNSTESGKEQIDNLEEKSSSNLENTNLMKTVVSELQIEMKQINTITATIQNIAKQTHLLALNATIEAARAGEAGIGFSVVAQEVKSLSEQTNTEANNIRIMIEKIVKNTTKLTDSFKQVSEGTASQNLSVYQTKTSFSEITSFIENINGQLYNITDYLQEMDSQKDNLVQLVQQINSSATEIAQNSHNVQQYTEEQLNAVKKVHVNSNVFNSLSKNLSSSVEIFKI